MLMMARVRERSTRELERGAITFLVQPRKTADEIAHVLMRLEPETAERRSIVIGRKRLGGRFWAMVVAAAAAAVEDVAAGDYRIYEHDGHTHLAFDVRERMDEPLRRAIGLHRSGSFIVTVMNPDPAVWEGEVRQQQLFPGRERIVTTPFPPHLQERFGGRKYAKLDTPEFLEYPGAELVLISE